MTGWLFVERSVDKHRAVRQCLDFVGPANWNQIWPLADSSSSDAESPRYSSP